MTSALLDRVASLGLRTAGLWSPVLTWTMLGVVTLILLRAVRLRDPAVHEKIRSLLLLSLPVAVLMSALASASWTPLPRVAVTVPDWGRTTWEAPVNAGHELQMDPDRSTTPRLPAGLVWGVAFIAAIVLTGIGLLRGVRDWLALHWLSSRFRYVSPHEIEGASQLLSGTEHVRLRIAVTPDDIAPMAFGLRQPVVVVPQSLLSDPRALHLTVLHEMVHIRRGDVLMHTLEHFVAIMFAFHPLVHWLRRQVREYREMACDAEVLGNEECRPDEYASLLLRLASAGATGSAALGVGGTFTHLRRRIMNMYDSTRTQQSGRGRRLGWMAGLIVAASTVLAVACTELTTEPRPDLSEPHGEVLFSTGSFEAALAQADRMFDGKLLVYFRSSDEGVTETLERHLFANPEYARFMNGSVARYALPVDSEQALAIMERYNVTSRTDSPLLMLVSGRAILMTTLDEVDSPEAAAEKMAQVRVALAPSRTSFGLDLTLRGPARGPGRFEINEFVQPSLTYPFRDQKFTRNTTRNTKK